MISLAESVCEQSCLTVCGFRASQVLSGSRCGACTRRQGRVHGQFRLRPTEGARAALPLRPAAPAPALGQASVPPASLPPATRRQEWAPAGQKGPLPSRDSHLGQDTCTETDSRQARRVGNPLDRGPPPDPLYPKTLRPPRGPGLPSVSWRKEAGPGKGLEALRTCSAAHRVVAWPWALRAGWHLRSEVV